MNQAGPMPMDGVGRRRARISVPTITLAHGSGGKAMHDLIDDVLAGTLYPEQTEPLEDQARLALDDLAALGDRLAFTTDSYVVDPLFFPGGDIGKLAVAGTVNDLAVGGAVPLYLSCAVVIEEGLPVGTLRQIVDSMRRTADAAGVRIVTGDTKVVDQGAADKLFINTAGIGVIRRGVTVGVDRARPGDVVLVSGVLGEHGAAIMNARGDLGIDAPLASDCAPLHGLVEAILTACPDTRCLRDATRGGVATVLNEIAQASNTGIEIVEQSIPVREAVRGVCEILGLDPFYLANEGKLVAVVPAAEEAAVLAAMRAHPLGEDAAAIGRVTKGPAGRVIMETLMGGRRVVDMLVGDQLPRIC